MPGVIVRLAVAQPGEQVLADVGDRLQRENARKPLVPLIVWIVRKMLPSRSRESGLALELDQVAVELVEVLVALHEELLDDLVETFKVLHDCLHSHPSVGTDTRAIGCGRSDLRIRPP